ncbi:hypothetical protein [Pedobacter psychroterrae]|nr:hypothetical protein [Pedobacter psychroterrae]
MSIYLEFPAIEDYPVYIPLEHIVTIIPEWIVSSFQSCSPESGLLSTEEK